VVQWTGNTTSCLTIRCPSLNTPDHAIQSGNGCGGPNSSYSTSCFFSCMLGYEAVGGSQKRTCLESREWSGTEIQCKPITCRPITIPSEGLDITPPFCTNVSAVIHYATDCRFTCKSGYQHHGPGLKTCNQQKTWSPLGNPWCKGEPLTLRNSAYDIGRRIMKRNVSNAELYQANYEAFNIREI